VRDLRSLAETRDNFLLDEIELGVRVACYLVAESAGLNIVYAMEVKPRPRVNYADTSGSMDRQAQ